MAETVKQVNSDVSEKRTFYNPGTVLEMPNGVKYVLVAGQGWKLVDDKLRLQSNQ